MGISFCKLKKVILIVLVIGMITAFISPIVEAASLISKTSITIKVGQEYWLTAYNKLHSLNKWTSSNTSVATVQAGKVIGKKAGTSTITVKTTSGKTATCKVIVKDVRLNRTELTLNVGQGWWMSVHDLASGNVINNATFTSSNPQVVKMEGWKAVGVRVGTAIITGTTKDGMKATCKITVKSAKNNVKEGIRLNRAELTLDAGQEWWMSVHDARTGNVINNVTFTSSNTQIVRMEGAKAIGVGGGTATITGRTKDGKSATCKITVTDSKNYNYGDNTYKLAVQSGQLTKLLNCIQTGHLYQHNNGRLTNHCDEVANYYIYYLLGINKIKGKEVNLQNPNVTNLLNIGDNEGRELGANGNNYYSVLKSNIDAGKPVRIHVNCYGGGNLGHWVVAIGYKGNGNKLSDYLLIGTYYGELFIGGGARSEAYSLFDYSMKVYN